MEPETKVEPETEPVKCKFTGYLTDKGEMVIETDSDECRRDIVAAGEELGVKVECKPCQEAAKKFVAEMQAKKAVPAEPAEPVPAEPVTES